MFAFQPPKPTVLSFATLGGSILQIEVAHVGSNAICGLRVFCFSSEAADHGVLSYVTNKAAETYTMAAQGKHS